MKKIVKIVFMFLVLGLTHQVYSLSGLLSKASNIAGNILNSPVGKMGVNAAMGAAQNVAMGGSAADGAIRGAQSSMYQQQMASNMNPMMGSMNPMMSGMNPMMGSGMGMGMDTSFRCPCCGNMLQVVHGMPGMMPGMQGMSPGVPGMMPGVQGVGMQYGMPGMPGMMPGVGMQYGMPGMPGMPGMMPGVGMQYGMPGVPGMMPGVGMQYGMPGVPGMGVYHN